MSGCVNTVSEEDLVVGFSQKSAQSAEDKEVVSDCWLAYQLGSCGFTRLQTRTMATHGSHTWLHITFNGCFGTSNVPCFIESSPFVVDQGLRGCPRNIAAFSASLQAASQMLNPSCLAASWNLHNPASFAALTTTLISSSLTALLISAYLFSSPDPLLFFPTCARG